MAEVDPVSCACCVLLTFTLSGLLQAHFLGLECTRIFAVPLDGGWCPRGRPLLGTNKTWRSVVILLPATAGSCWLSARLLQQLGLGGLWRLDATQWLTLGLALGLGYLLGELPNSFVKRRCGIAPGQTSQTRLGRQVCFWVDQFDSVIGVLVALACRVPCTWTLVLVLLGCGALWHWVFACLYYLLGLKSRPA